MRHAWPVDGWSADSTFSGPSLPRPAPVARDTVDPVGLEYLAIAAHAGVGATGIARRQVMIDFWATCFLKPILGASSTE
jgi:hypothetical protein